MFKLQQNKATLEKSEAAAINKMQIVWDNDKTISGTEHQFIQKTKQKLLKWNN